MGPSGLVVVDYAVCGKVEDFIRHEVEFFQPLLGCIFSFEDIDLFVLEKACDLLYLQTAVFEPGKLRGFGSSDRF